MIKLKVQRETPSKVKQRQQCQSEARGFQPRNSLSRGESQSKIKFPDGEALLIQAEVKAKAEKSFTTELEQKIVSLFESDAKRKFCLIL